MIKELIETKVFDENENIIGQIGIDKELKFLKIFLYNDPNMYKFACIMQIIDENNEVLFYHLFKNESINIRSAAVNIKSVLLLVNKSTVDLYLCDYTDKNFKNRVQKISSNKILKCILPGYKFIFFDEILSMLKRALKSYNYEIHSIYNFDFNDKWFKREVNNV